MKRIILFLFSVLLSAQLFTALSEEQIVLSHTGGGHNEHYQMADMPDAVYYDNVTHEIIIEADGTSLYYNVQIVSNQLQQTVISTQVSGYGDTIDVSSLSSGLYTIVITSQFYNMYEGYVVI